MSKNGTPMSDPDQHLDRILSDMAEDVPPVPDDVRQRWRQAVRLEMEAAAPDLSEAKALQTSADTKTRTNTDAVVRSARFLRFLQVAAVFLFVLGGVMAGRPSLFLRQEAAVSPSYQDAHPAAHLPKATEMPSASPGAGTYVLNAQRDKTFSSDYLKDSLLSAEPATYAMDAGTAEEETFSPDFERTEEADSTAVSEEGNQADDTAFEDTEEADVATASEAGKQAEDSVASDDSKKTDDTASALPLRIGGLALILLSVLILMLSRRRQCRASS